MDSTKYLTRQGTAPPDTPKLIPPAQIAAWVGPALLAGVAVPVDLWEKLGEYLQLLLRWNARMNLTAVRDSEELMRVHLAECVRCGQMLPTGIKTLLDFGSGAGLPGIPIQLMRPEIAVTLAESQGKKAGFLREAVRVLGLSQASVYGGRVEALSAGQRFDVVTLRAVEEMERALLVATERIEAGGWCVVLTTEGQARTVQATLPELRWSEAEGLPGSRQRVVLLGQKAG